MHISFWQKYKFGVQNLGWVLFDFLSFENFSTNLKKKIVNVSNESFCSFVVTEQLLIYVKKKTNIIHFY